MSTPFAHVAGMPIEEAVAAAGPALFLVLSAMTASLRAHLRRWRGGRS